MMMFCASWGDTHVVQDATGGGALDKAALNLFGVAIGGFRGWGDEERGGEVVAEDGCAVVVVSFC